MILAEHSSPTEDILTIILFFAMTFGLASSITVTEVAPVEELPHSSVSSYMIVCVPSGKPAKVKPFDGLAVNIEPSGNVAIASHVISLISLQLSLVVESIGLGTIRSASQTHGPVDNGPSILGVVNTGPSTSATLII